MSDDTLNDAEKQNILVGRLAAYGVNSIIGSYDQRQKVLVDAFLSLPLKFLIESWDYLNDNVKLRIITHHKDEIKKWINNS